MYFHEDDYCQQQLLPIESGEYAINEIKKINAFSDEHRAPDGVGWSAMYLRKESQKEFNSLNVNIDELNRIISPYMPKYNAVYTGYSTYREKCKSTAAWGISDQCVLFADWNNNNIVANVWCRYFESEDKYLLPAVKAVSTLAKINPLLYIDWEWNYICNPADEENFISLLRDKLKVIEENIRRMKG